MRKATVRFAIRVPAAALSLLLLHVSMAAAAAPSAPTGVTATPASSQAQVSWTTPASNGGSAITGYTITPYIGSAAQAQTQVSNGSATSAVVTGLTNGTGYTFTVIANNSGGASPESSPSNAVTPEDTIFDFNGTPGKVDSGDPGSGELGVKFTADSSGYVTGVRFLKGTTLNGGTHVGSLWDVTGKLLAQATFTGETGSGWQTVTFASPVAISSGATYVAGYFDPQGHYSSTTNGLASSVDNPPLHAVANGVSVDGVYAYSTSPVFPTSTYQANNYWVDVLFQPGAIPLPGQPTGVTAAAGPVSANLSWTAPTSGGPVSSYIITPYIGAAAQATTTVGGSTTSATVNGLAAGTSYTFTVTASNATGPGSPSAQSNAVTPTAASAPSAPTGVSASPATRQALVSWTAPASNGGASVTGYTVTPYIGAAAQTPVVVSSGSATSTVVAGLSNGTAYTFTVAATNGAGTGPASSPSSPVTPEDTILDFSGTPSQPDSGNSTSEEHGVKFTVDTAGTVTGVRFWKAAANTGTHVGSLWDASGNLLAQATFTNETASGWQYVTFAAPVSVSPGTTYVAAYFGPNGHYSTTPYGLANGIDNPPVHAVADSVSVDGLYALVSTPTFPTNSYHANNYWVDVLFAPTPATPPGQVTGVTATAGVQSATVSWNPPASGGAATSYTVTPYAAGSAQPAITVSGTTTSTTVSGLTVGTSYTFTVQASNAAGSGPVSVQSNAVTPTAGPPGAPTGVTATAGVQSATVAWTAPVNNGGSGITSYTVTPYIGSTAQPTTTVSGSTTSTTVGGLTAGQSYTFTVTATNASTTGPASTPSNSVTPTPPPPGQVTGVTATAGQQSATVSWSAPTTGGPAVTYTVTPYIGPTAQPSTAVSAPTTSTTVIGLTAGQSYTFTVQASNSGGSGPVSSPSNAVTPTPSSATPPGAPTGVTANPASGQALVSWTPPASNGGASITGYTVTPYVGSTAGTPVQVGSGTATSTVVKGLTNGTAYTFTVAATNSAGTGPASAQSGGVTPEYTIFDFNGTPLKADSGDSSAGEEGVKFTADVNGYITGIRFLKGTSLNAGTHVGSLWDASGNLLAQATFGGETATGWQYVLFASPVAITAGTTYVAGYFTPKGHYSSSTNGLSTAIDNAPLHSVANSVSADGVYAYSSSPAFPTQTYQANNYWVDVLFASSVSVPAAPSNPTATPGNGSASVSWSAPWNGGSTITSYTVTPYTGGVAQTPTTVTGTPPVTTATVNGLTNGTTYTFTITAANANGTGPASASTNAVTPGAQPQGAWSPNVSWPLVAVHSTLMTTGRVLLWDAYQEPAPTQEYDLSTQTFTSPLNAPDGIFCSAMAELPDGRIITIGGYGAPASLGIIDTAIYDPKTSTWTRVADMHYVRWYPGFAELPDGRYLAVSGNTTDSSHWADTPEVYDPSSNTWTLLSGISTSQVHEVQYPQLHLLPDGNMFVLGPKEDVTFKLSVANQTWTQVGGASGLLNGASIMYRPGKILYTGGAPSLSSQSNAAATAATIDFTQSSPAWQKIAPMNYARAYHTLTMLPDGTVFVEGGEPITGLPNGQGEASGGVLQAEIWNPSTGQWTVMASAAVTRGYHHTAILLPDGRVLVAGGGHAVAGYTGQYSAQYYSPPYLFNGPRPTISSAPAAAAYGSSITVNTPDAASIKAVNLVDVPVTTHEQDFGNHFVPLSFTAGSGSLSVTMPANGNYAPPGNYMLFIINGNGVPSVASFINLSSTGTAPGMSRDVGGRGHVNPPAAAPARGYPTFIQRASSYHDRVRRLPVVLRDPVNGGDRLVVETSTWGGGASAASVSDSLHDRYTEVLRRVAADGTELGVWTAPVAYGRAGQVTVTVRATRRADIGAVALEYAGLSTAPGMAAIDSIASAAGTTGHAATVSASPAGRTATPGELELGLYADSGFGDALKAGSGFSERFNSPATEGEMEMLAEDRVLRAGSRPAATAATGSATPWLLADVVFRTAAARPGTAAPMLDARARPAGAAIPLSARRRPHPVAGAVTALLLRGPNGRLVRFYCLVNPSGEPRVSSAWRRIGGPGLTWSDSALESLR